MKRARLRSFATLLSVLLSAFMGESVAWHDHPFEANELSAWGVAVVEHEGEYESQVHYDRGEYVHRPACWACILASSPTEAAAAPSVPAGLERCGELAPAPAPEIRGERPQPSAARGPPSTLPPISA